MAGKHIVVAVLLALAISILALYPAQKAPASTSNPSVAFKVNGLTVDAANVCHDTATTFSVPVPDPNYGTLITFYPRDWYMAGGAAIPDGAKVGLITNAVTISLASAPCFTALPVIFDFYDADTDVTDELSHAEVDYWLNKGCGLASCTPDNRGATPGSGADGLPDYLNAVPYFVNDMVDPDGRTGPKSPIEPISRIAGEGIVAGTQILLQMLIFDPGDLAALGGAYKEMGTEMGYPTLIILNNPIESYLAAGPSAIGDFCTPLLSTTTFYGVTQAGYGGVGAGIDNVCNPPANTGILNTGTHLHRAFNQTQRDIDHTGTEADGIENNMDTCPFTDSSAWDPRAVGGTGTGDTDGDGIPDDCDNTVDEDVNYGDADYDLFPNRQDNCPQVANGALQDNQRDLECEAPGPAWDWGPKCDGIGDACETNDEQEDGHYHQRLLSAAVCIGGVDPDTDGWCTATENLLGSDPNNPAKTPESIYADEVMIVPGAYPDGPNTGESTWASFQSCSDGVNNDGEGGTDEGDAAGDYACNRKPASQDTDGDLWKDHIELYLSTDVMQKCKDGVHAWHDAWPLDNDRDAACTFTGDVYAYVGKIGAITGTANWLRRLDLDMDYAITFTGDVYLFVGNIGQTCTVGD